ncbi:MAG TPA: hypothetical protein VEX62_10750 [Candidatus Limnocylindrales bacterium]|nr:hypothetical protein [Candidatus Limnocylindrales bacterium]
MTYTNTATQVRWQPWTYQDPSWHSADLTGYKVQAVDGEIGKVDKDTFEVDNSFLVVDTGPWIFGRKVMLPAGVVSGMDHQNKLVFVSRTKDLIKNSPEFTDELFEDMKYRERLGSYYGEEGAGWYNNPVR